MTIQEALELMEEVSLVEPCEKALEAMRKNGSRRQMPLSEIENDPGKCTWCGKELSGKRSRWCSSACLQSGENLCYPQGPQAKIYRLIHKQNCACAACGISFEDQIIESIKKYDFRNQRDHNNDFAVKGQKRKVTYYQIGYGTGMFHQLDHIQPIHQGGAGIDPNNLQVLCTNCHKIKSARERSRWFDR